MGRDPSRTAIASAVGEERSKLIDDLRSLDAEQWSAASLCSGWQVRDVAAHLVRIGDYYRRQYPFEVDLVRYGFRLDKALAEVAKRIASHLAPNELIGRLEDSRYEETLVYRLHPQPLFALNEWVVHGQDIRRPLGLSASFEGDRLIPLAEVAQKWYAWGSRGRKLEVRLEATDADWAIGEGPTYRGPLEAIVMVCNGRTSAMAELVPT